MSAKKRQAERVATPEAILELDKEIFALRNQRAVQKKLEQPHLLKAKRHEKARLLTLMTQERRRANG